MQVPTYIHIKFEKLNKCVDSIIFGGTPFETGKWLSSRHLLISKGQDFSKNENHFHFNGLL